MKIKSNFQLAATTFNFLKIILHNFLINFKEAVEKQKKIRDSQKEEVDIKLKERA